MFSLNRARARSAPLWPNGAQQVALDLRRAPRCSRSSLVGEELHERRLAATWYRNGPEKGHETLAAVFSALAARQLLRIDDARVAAEQFTWLVLIPLNRAMFITRPVDTSDLHRAADRAVDIFLAAYGSREP